MPSEKSYLERVQNRTALWVPQSKPQWQALLSRADELFYGGAAGGGKTDLVLGLATECHQHSQIFRRVYPNLHGVMVRAREIIGSNAKENKSEKTWTWEDDRTIEFGAVQHENDKTNWQGRPSDLKAFDEIPEFTESQYVFICGWNRTTIPGQRVRVVVTGNPPIDEAGSWVFRRWGPWVDPNHPNPAKPGELRWYATVAGDEIECENGEPFERDGEKIYPRSRTFIPALLEDNPFLSSDNRYRSVLQSLPEPLRSMFLKGDFTAAAVADPFQVIPSEWVRAAQRRWLERERPEKAVPAYGLDPSRGGNDKTALAARYDNWYDEPVAWPGVIAKDGPTVAELVRQAIGDNKIQYINIDVVGIGSSVYDSMKPLYKESRPFSGGDGSDYRDRSGKLKMRNKRAEMYWKMRDALDPDYGDDIALPPGNELLADLCSARYSITTAGVLIEPKDKIKERIGRSPDIGEAVMMANLSPSRVVLFEA